MSSLPTDTLIDIATESVPHVGSATVSCGSFRPLVSWTQTASPVQPDAVIAIVDIENSVTPRLWKWTLVMPPETASPVAYPEVPTSFLPTGPRTISMEALTLLKSSLAGVSV